MTVIQAVLFDAVGTLIRPAVSVATTYREVGLRYGSRRTQDAIQARFRQALAEQFGAVDGRYRETDAAGERQRWRTIVAQVFDDLEETEPLFETLWSHFARPDSWQLYPDVVPAWQGLRERGLRVGIASNFDQRLEWIARGLPPLDQMDLVLHSANLGFAKPDPRFYQELGRRLGLPASDILLVGDDPQHDYHAPRAAGLAALWLRREQLAGDPADAPTGEAGGRAGQIASLVQVAGFLDSPSAAMRG